MDDVFPRQMARLGIWFATADSLSKVAGASLPRVNSFLTAHVFCDLVRAWLRATAELINLRVGGARSSIIVRCVIVRRY